MKSKDIAIVGILLAIGFVMDFILRSLPCYLSGTSEY